uniref:Uncharacterized protein n=1 Tax=Kalanchoe fedtschenkoi TaxID=63787 RepID=A0A7N0T0D7_KALFE
MFSFSCSDCHTHKICKVVRISNHTTTRVIFNIMACRFFCLENFGLASLCPIVLRKIKAFHGYY